MAEFLDSLDQIDLVERWRKERTIRDRLNPLESFSDTEFRDRFRFPKHFVVLQILPLVSNELQVLTDRNNPATPIFQLLITLRFYATNNFQLVAGDLAGFSQPSISRYVHHATAVLAKNYSSFVKLVSAAEAAEMRQKFYKMKGMPGVIGTIDCTHVPIKKPSDNDPERFRNRKNIFSVNIQVIADADLMIRDVVARWPGSVHDSRIFDNSKACELFESGRMPEGFLLGDQGYACRSYLITPFASEDDRSQAKFNAAHRRTRLSIERLFGAWKRTFPCLSGTLRFEPDRCTPIVSACAVLWNMRRKLRIDENKFSENDSDDETELEEENAALNANSNRDTLQGNIVRNRICQEYFK